MKDKALLYLSVPKWRGGGGFVKGKILSYV